MLQGASGDFPHLMFYGPSGAGKKTRIMCFLREIFGASAEKVLARAAIRGSSHWTFELTD